MWNDLSGGKEPELVSRGEWYKLELGSPVQTVLVLEKKMDPGQGLTCGTNSERSLSRTFI